MRVAWSMSRPLRQLGCASSSMVARHERAATASPPRRSVNRAVSTAAANAPVRVLILHPRDPAEPTVGGIQTFLLDFIKYAPPDFEATFAGTTPDRRARRTARGP